MMHPRRSAKVNFNPRSPHGERPLHAYNDALQQAISIHAPRTGSDVAVWTIEPQDEHFNPRSPHGERRRTATHKRRRERFQSTLPARGATDARTLGRRERPISIHAPRTGSDGTTIVVWWAARNFNPRSPHGERRGTAAVRRRLIYFNPRSPHGERRVAGNRKEL